MKIHRLICSIIAIILFISIYQLYPQEVKYTRTEDVVYGRKDGMALTMDVFQPEKPNGIGVVLLISGGWHSTHDAINVEWIARIKKLIEADETVFAVVHGSMPKYKIPDIQKDIERAVRYIRYNAAKWKVDTGKIGIVGHSSGGHLSLLHAATAKKGEANAKDPINKTSAEVNAVAVFYPPTSFMYFGAKGINALTNPRFQKFLPAFVNSITDTTELIKIAEAVSPVIYVNSSMPPTLLISGNADKLVPFQQTEIFIDKLKEMKVPYRLETKEGKDHGWEGIENEYKLISEWFEKYLIK